MDNQLEKRYGLPTAIAMVIGIVIGSGVFFKAEKILTATGGDLPTGILAWLIGGLIMVICAYVFAVMATRYEKVNGVIDYAEVTIGDKYGYLVGWFLASIYYPTLTSVLSWISARYFCVLLGWDITSGSCLVIAAFFMITSFAVNALSPRLAGKFQVTTTVIKLIPLFLMAIVGTVFGLKNGVLIENFSMGAVVEVSGNPLFAAVVATSFAYEGWIIATSINAELRNAKRNLPIALIAGTGFIIIMYICFYIGLAGAVENEVMMQSGEAAAKLAYSTIFSQVGGTVLFVFIVLSCLGTLNGLMLACTRGFYALAVRDRGPKPQMFKQVDPGTKMPVCAAILGLFMAGFWLLYFFGANLAPTPWFGPFCFDSSELPIVTIYAFYIPIFIMMMKKEKDLPVFKRFVMPALAVCASIFMVIAAIYAHKWAVFYYFLIFLAFMAVGIAYMKKKQ